MGRVGLPVDSWSDTSLKKKRERGKMSGPDLCQKSMRGIVIFLQRRVCLCSHGFDLESPNLFCNCTKFNRLGRIFQPRRSHLLCKERQTAFWSGITSRPKVFTILASNSICETIIRKRSCTLGVVKKKKTGGDYVYLVDMCALEVDYCLRAVLHYVEILRICLCVGLFGLS